MAKTAVNCPPAVTPTAPEAGLVPAMVTSVVLFDNNGNIVHGHQEAFLPGAAQMLPATVIANAQRAFEAMNPNKPSSDLSALSLNGALADNMCPGVSYKVVDCQLVRG